MGGDRGRDRRRRRRKRRKKEKRKKEKKEEGKKGRRKEEEEKEEKKFLHTGRTNGWTDQSKVVQEVLADLKRTTSLLYDCESNRFIHDLGYGGSYEQLLERS